MVPFFYFLIWAILAPISQVLNSIDASAAAIAVRVDLQNFRIQVVDNGCGLSSSDLNFIGIRFVVEMIYFLTLLL